MMNSKIDIARISNGLPIIEAYIIDEQNDRNRIREDSVLNLPCPEYEMELEKPVTEDCEHRVIIIEL